MPMVRMGVVRDVARVQGSQAKVLDFLANFENVASWDPGVKTAQRIGTGTDIGVGTAFDVLCLSQGDEIPFIFTIKELDEHKGRVVLFGDSDVITTTDTIVVEEDGNECVVTYEAEMRLKGWRRPFIAFLGGQLNALGRAAMEGLERRLNTS